jgi:uncharacterized RDD family membrane protein YckC
MVGISAPLMPSPVPLDELRPAAPVSARALAPAGFLRRSAAALVDGVVLLGFLFLDYYVLVKLLGWSVDRAAAGATDVLFFVVALGFAWVYCALPESSGAGRTLGKRLLGLSVRDRAGEVPGLGRATLRFAARFLTLATVLLGWLLILVTGRRRALHDLIAGTIVVVDDRAPA